MKSLIFTLYEGHYDYGVAALINSAIESGFQGQICVFHREELPAWTSALKRTGECDFEIRGCSIRFHQLKISRHLGFHKPFAAKTALELFPECDSVIYADPDVVFLAPWCFFETWIADGLAVCLDSNFPHLPSEHPWRTAWARLLKQATGKEANLHSPYANGGFFAVMRHDSAFLDDWMAITKKYEENGGDTISYQMSERYKPIVGCQDTMAVALSGWTKKKSVLGPEGMGFTGHFFILSHDIGSPKPWKRNFIRDALAGVKPSQSAAFYLRYCNAPIATYSSMELWRKKLAFKIAQAISRIWKR